MQEEESEAFEAATESESTRPVKRESLHRRRSSPYNDEEWPEKDRRRGIFRAAEHLRESSSEQEAEQGGRHRPDLASRLGPCNNGLSGAPAYSSIHRAESGFKGSAGIAQSGKTGGSPF